MDERAWPELASYLTTANEVLAFLRPHLPPEEQAEAAGFFCLCDEAGEPRLVGQIGLVPVEKLAGRFRRALEKPLRAALAGQETSRWGGRDEARDRWAGALWGDKSNLYGAFAGLPEDFDELLVAEVLVRTGDLSPVRARDYLEGENKEYPKLRQERLFYF